MRAFNKRDFLASVILLSMAGGFQGGMKGASAMSCPFWKNCVHDLPQVKKASFMLEQSFLTEREAAQNMAIPLSFKPFSYERCEWPNKTYTERITKEANAFLSQAEALQRDSVEVNFRPYLPLFSAAEAAGGHEGAREGDIPPECFFASAVRGASAYKPGKAQFAYCEKDSSQAKSLMPVEDDANRERLIQPRRACLSGDYVNMTARAFNKMAYCFGLSKEEKEGVFRLFNYESSFLHNVKSASGAKCYGQLTGVLIDDISTRIYFRDIENPPPYSHIYSEALARCPLLAKKALNEKITQTVEEAGGKSQKALEDILKKTPRFCAITQDPHSCLFYALFNIKQNTLAIEDRLKKPSTPSLQEAFAGYPKLQALLPIRLNEMLALFPEDGGAPLLFHSNKELKSFAAKYSSLEEPAGRFEAGKAPLFENEQEVKELFSHWTYNGGISIATDYMGKFIQSLKESISRPCGEGAKAQRCAYRKRIEEGFGLPSEAIQKEFRAYIGKSYSPASSGPPLIQRQREVADFLDNIHKAMLYLHNPESAFTKHLMKVIPSLSERDALSAQKNIQTVCPKPLNGGPH